MKRRSSTGHRFSPSCDCLYLSSSLSVFYKFTLKCIVHSKAERPLELADTEISLIQVEYFQVSPYFFKLLIFVSLTLSTLMRFHLASITVTSQTLRSIDLCPHYSVFTKTMRMSFIWIHFDFQERLLYRKHSASL